MGLFSELLLGLLFALPAIELQLYKRLRSLGVSFRAAVVMMVDVALIGKQTFPSIWWELVAVVMSLIFVFYTPLIWRRLVSKGE